ncbi:hypothetical protein B0T18DRAFT_433875 [Schizothecium vesticola]|uniref:AAA+ ATPase domain-containing protein n=1 Tax=Schizothecium vesticola TaxID=314040 RepID=A0AA40F883_9PEZI|nr:hypothetical protein B0T18DRAFT_433875 [Schizothecium vesticola]
MADVTEMVDITPVKDLFAALKERFHAVFQGNPWVRVGKTTVAKLYAKLLHSLGAASGHVLILEDAHRLGSGAHLEAIISEIKEQGRSLVVIFTGGKSDIDRLLNAGIALNLRDRFTHIVDLEDFSKEHLHTKMLGLVEEVYGKRCEIEGGKDGPYIGAAIRRLAHARGTPGFENGRSVEKLFAQFRKRQALRLTQTRLEALDLKKWLQFTKEDVMGPCPSQVKQTSTAWAELKALTGLRRVKESVELLFDIVKENYERELLGKAPLAVTLNRVFLGSPGTGKTTVAKLYATVLGSLACLAMVAVLVIKTAPQFFGEHRGETENITREILRSTVGKVLVIDEAYMFDPGYLSKDRASDGTAVLDTIVSEVQGYPGEDRCVILLGYQNEMEALFQNGNPGLSGRFMADQPFYFEDYTKEELCEIMDSHLKSQDLQCAEGASDVAMAVLARARNAKHFSNRREVKTLTPKAILRYCARRRPTTSTGTVPSLDGILSPEDFDPTFNSGDASTTKRLGFRGLLEGKIADSVKTPGHRARSSLVPRTFVLKGPSGTGKTTVATQMGAFFCNLGRLSTNDVFECEAQNLVGHYLGQTTATCRDHLERGLGKVLVINNIYTLSANNYSGSGYDKEAIGEIISFTRKHAAKMVTLLTRPPQDMDTLMAERPDLAALFRSEVTFAHFSPPESLALLTQGLRAEGVACPSLETPEVKREFHKAMEVMSAFPCWSNASDIEHLVLDMFQEDLLCVPEKIPMDSIKAMFKTKSDRAKLPKKRIKWTDGLRVREVRVLADRDE